MEQAVTVRPRSRLLKVTRSKVDGLERRLTLSNGSEIAVHRFACVGEGDEIRLNGSKEIVVVCQNGTCDISVPLQKSSTIKGLGALIYVKEITTAAEYAGYEKLAAYHYRNSIGFGRRAILVARLGSGKSSRILGYIEITNTFAGHEARNRLLDSSFADGDEISWTAWNLAARKKYLNTIARISRCVVHPEFRGFGIGIALTKGAIEFCKTRWQIAKLKPIFLEITADMLKFVPFAEKAGMHFIGNTGGNLSRLRKDQRYLQSVEMAIQSGDRSSSSHAVFSADAKSILQRQRRDVQELKALAQSHNVDVLDLLTTYMDATSAGELTSSAYDLLHRFLRFPKPTYMVGLTPHANAFLSRRLSELKLTPPELQERLTVRPISSPIEINDLSIQHTINVPVANWANDIQEAFGIRRNRISSTGVTKLILSISPRELLYIWGPSGSGKTVLLETIQKRQKSASGTILIPRDARFASLSFDFPERPLARQFDLTFNETIYLLGQVGLAETNLFFKLPSQLSAGQRYRLALARLMTARAPIWIIDEFCSILDDTTTKLISSKVGTLARTLGATCIIAGPRTEPVISSLGPDRILKLDSLGDWRIEKP